MVLLLVLSEALDYEATQLDSNRYCIIVEVHGHQSWSVHYVVTGLSRIPSNTSDRLQLKTINEFDKISKEISNRSIITQRKPAVDCLF